MASSSSSSSRTYTYDVFPSFRGKDVRKSFLSHLLESLHRKSIDTFIDDNIDRSRPIGPELLLAIKESMISIVVFSKSYASSTWCLNELLEIHKCFKELSQMVIPVFYGVETFEVRYQTGEFGKAFEVTCKDETEAVKQLWSRALYEVASIAGYDSQNWSKEAIMIEDIAKDVLYKLITPSNGLENSVGIEAHIETMNTKFCLESEEARMVGILGPSGIGKTTIARALYNKLSSQFRYHAFVTYERTNMDNNYDMKLRWEEQLLSMILGEKDMKISHLGVVKQRLKRKKVLIVLDDVDDLEILKTLVGQPGWFGPGSRIIVTTKDRQLLRSHKIDNVYEVEFPSRELALQILCQAAFGEDSPPDGFMELAVEVAELAGNLPLGLNIMGSSLRARDKEVWMEMMPRLRNSLDGRIEKTLRVSYDGLDAKDQEIFLYIACLLNGHRVSYITDVIGDDVNTGLRMLAEKSLIRIAPGEFVEMHSLLKKLGEKINRGESFYNAGKRRFLVNADDICDVFTDNTGTETVLGISFNTSEIKEPLFIDKKSFQRMHNLRFLRFYDWSWESSEGRLYIPQGLAYLPRKLSILYWYKCPLKFIPLNFKAEYLVELTMRYSDLERLWEGTQRLKYLKRMDLYHSKKLKEIPDLSYAINLEEMDLDGCKSLVTLSSSIRNLNKLKALEMRDCSKLEVLPTDVTLEYLDQVYLHGCSQLKSFPQISRSISLLYLSGTAMEEESCVWIENMSRLTHLDWDSCPLRCLPSKFRPDDLVYISMTNSKLEKLWEGAKSLGKLKEIKLSGSKLLSEFPNLSKATKLERLYLDGCISLVTVPSSIQSLSKLREFHMERCIELESLPTNVNLESLHSLYLNGCSELRSFPRISKSIDCLHLDHTGIEQVPSWIEDFSELTTLMMRGCPRLRNISRNIFKLKCLKVVNFSDSAVTEFGDASVLTRISRTIDDLIALFADSTLLLGVLLVCGLLVKHVLICEEFFKLFRRITDFFTNPESRLNFDNCLGLYGSAETVILESDYEYAVLPGGEVPKFLTYRACGSSILLSILLPESSLSEEYIGFKACVVLEPPSDPNFSLSCVGVYCYFRGKYAVHRLHFDRDSSKMDHLLMFHFRFPTQELLECPSELDWEDMEFEFYHHMYASLDSYYSVSTSETSTYSVQRIKGCGIEFWDVFPRILTQAEIDTHLCFSDEGDEEDEGDGGDGRRNIWTAY